VLRRQKAQGRRLGSSAAQDAHAFSKVLRRQLRDEEREKAKAAG
jgi:hypothetical protein